jgi:hypothetical protein
MCLEAINCLQNRPTKLNFDRDINKVKSREVDADSGFSLLLRMVLKLSPPAVSA